MADEDGRAFCISSILTSRRGVTTRGIVTQCGKVLHLVHWIDLDSFAAMTHNKRERVLEKISLNSYSLTHCFSPSFSFFNPILCKTLPSVNHFSEIINLSVHLPNWRYAQTYVNVILVIVILDTWIWSDFWDWDFFLVLLFFLLSKKCF